MDEEQVDAVFVAFKELADRKKEVFEGDLIALVEQVVRGSDVATWKLDYMHTAAGTAAIATATVTVSKEGERLTDAATGDGPVDAIINALDRICGVSGELEDYRIRAVTGGRDAQGEVSMRVRFGDHVVGGRGLSTDVIHASSLAYLDAINRVSYMGEKLDFRSAEEATP